MRLHFASREAGRAAGFRDELGGVRSFGGYRAALDDPEIDVAVVVTPPASHRDLTLAALEAGKHVIVEKPAFPRSSDFAAVREAAARADRRVLVAENYFYKPLRAELERTIRSGELGEPLFVRVHASKLQRAAGWRAEGEGGGALLEGGIHWVHLMAGLGLTVGRVTGYRAGGGRLADESAIVVFEYEEGPVGTLAYSWRVPSPLRGLRVSQILGTGGTATFESNGLFLLVRGSRLRLRQPGVRDISGYRAMFRDFVSCLRGGPPAAMTLELAERDVRLVEQARGEVPAASDGFGGER